MESSNINDNIIRFMNSINKNSNINDINHFKSAIVAIYQKHKTLFESVWKSLRSRAF